ncbi:MAG: lipopolysaccharide biosynthesis protein RfbH [Nanoarchaeota archaeon]
MTSEAREEIRKHLSQIAASRTQEFIPGKTTINYAGATYDSNEMIAFVDSFLDGWFGIGRSADCFEQELAKAITAKTAVLTNSGSSANLLAVAALCSPHYHNRLKQGDELITTAMAFPTTVNPAILYGLTPVFVDAMPGTYNPNIEDIKSAITPRTKAIMLAHTLGNPNEMDKLMKLADDNNLVVIEDCCDALGSTYDGKHTGSFGVMSTYSFYVAHHITMGEGGAVACNSRILDGIIRSLREWGRSCVCKWDEESPNGHCGKRFAHKVDGVTYDHRYTYSHIGYNLKPLEFQAAFGVKQLERLPFITRRRKENFTAFNNGLKQYADVFILPKTLPKSDPSWFGYPLTVKDDAPFTRGEIMQHLAEKLIQTRVLFAGNITRHKPYKDINRRIIGDLEGADHIMRGSFFLGCYPGITTDMITYILKTITEFMEEKT